ncbi:RNA-directed DNA polymerase (Reverse transcriptase), Ribonuclease H-like protein [Cucumis melo var. makuwa]|uniref:RNA-directed DNA polymerase (Reverse transcriptase), Ribonuclease H-like protein n=1 Tax=Cucumis melo var. makuwa TaxID=1194695 RepID=A0A5D3BUV7_CUCMM|nr:RNA-directed DNA polymerase (Reverse transcriptase), Ribonuclease H-like protein [Cucumis melo var. makuwa]
MSYIELLPQSHDQVAIVPQEPLQPLYSKWYNPNAKYKYHDGAVGHSTENCFPLKSKVQSLVKARWLKFKKTKGEPYVNQNPLPNHEGPAINVVDTFIERYMNKCLFQPKIDDHFVEDCCEFKNEVVDGWKDSLGAPKFEGNINEIVDFEVSIYNLEQNIEEDEYDISPELLRWIEQEGKKTMSYQETLTVINLGTPEEVKEVRIGTLAQEQDQSDLVILLNEFKYIFA